MKSDKGQTYILIGIGFIVLSFLILYISLSQPKVSDFSADVTVTTSQTNQTEVTDSFAGFPVNLNTATVNDLTMINGLGEKRAKSIIAYRDVIGKYTSVEEIKNISGIGDDIYNQVAEYLSV